MTVSLEQGALPQIVEKAESRGEMTLPDEEKIGRIEVRERQEPRFPRRREPAAEVQDEERPESWASEGVGEANRNRKVRAVERDRENMLREFARVRLSNANGVILCVC